MAEDPANERADVRGRQRGRRHLIQQRLEEVMVAPIEERDANAAPAREHARGGEPAKSAHDDEQVR
jgi:hypothetical protein